MKNIILLFIYPLFACSILADTWHTWRHREHATDVTSITDGLKYDLGYEIDSGDIFVCINDSGASIPSDWIKIGVGSVPYSGAIQDVNLGNFDLTATELTTTKINTNTAIPIDAYYSPIITDQVTTGAVTVNWDDSNIHRIILDNGVNTITMTNPKDGLRGLIILIQPSSGAAGTVTFSPVPKSPGGILPTLTATNGATDIVCLVFSNTDNKYFITNGLDFK